MDAISGAAGELMMSAASVNESVSKSVSGPNGGGRIAKLTVCKWINDGRQKISSDRGLRVQQSRQVAFGPQDTEFNIREDDWNVGIGNDVACLYKNSACIGRVLSCFLQN